MTYAIDANSTPVYGWVSDYWKVQDWIYWYDAMATMYGDDYAHKKFVEAYNDAPFLAACTNWRSFDDTFIQFAKNHNFYEEIFPGVVGSVVRFISGTRNVLGGTVSSAESISTSVAKIADVVVPVIFILVLGLFTWFIYMRFIKKS